MLTDYLQKKKNSETVTNNKNILFKIIGAIKFGGYHELALRGHDKSENSYNWGIFNDLLKVLSGLDFQLRQHLETATVNKDTSAAIQNELRGCIYEVHLDNTKAKLTRANFVAIEAD